ncbi:MAG: hypothetical protein QOE77_2079 [Blastocatellia bacterium]|jgi:hypothetical protein|nr:hypothetical protein [Blastocatellia bacterium]
MQPLILAFLTLASFNGSSLQTPAARSVSAGSRVNITSRRIVLRRNGDIAKTFPHRKTAVITYPIISGPGDPTVLRRLRAAIEFKNIFDYSLAEYRADAWLSEFSYVLNYNNNYLLDLTFTQSGVGAYPDEHTKHFLFNLKDGSIVKAADVFEADRLAALTAEVNRKLQRELKQIAADNAEGTTAEDRDMIAQAHEALKFEAADLDNFSVSSKGVTFLYDAGLPHVIQALAPAGKYFFRYATLRSYIKREGLLGRFRG